MVHWETGKLEDDDGDFGFILFNHDNESLYERPLSHADFDEYDDFHVFGNIERVEFITGTDGFHGIFRISNQNEIQSFMCLNCRTESNFSMELEEIYLDTDVDEMSPKRYNELQNISHCNRNSCDFILTGN